MKTISDDWTAVLSMVTVSTLAANDSDSALCDGDSVTKSPSVVRFAQHTEVYEISDLVDLLASPKDAEELWYASEEYEGFNDQCEVSAKKLEGGVRLNPKKHSEYGLEAWTKTGFRRQRRHRNESLDAVLDEQFAQWDDGVEDFDSIAELYQARSKHAQMVAVTRGLVLEREVHGVLTRAVMQHPSLFAHLSSSERSIYSQKSAKPLLPSTEKASSKSTSKSTRRSSASSKISKSKKSDNGGSSHKRFQGQASRQQASSEADEDDAGGKKRSSKSTDRPKFSSPKISKKKKKSSKRGSASGMRLPKPVVFSVQ